jgi:methionyl-tRNA formyltransferase
LKVLFLGTAEFACLSLEALLTSRHKVAAVVTQPDRPKGRGQRLAPSPVKFLAAKKNIPVFQPEKLRDPAALEILRSFHPDLIVVVAYGQILSPSVLSIPHRGCVNVHASLLPQYRGAAPIPWAILKDEQRTGVATMLMDSGLDTGPILLTEETPIAPEDTAGVLHDRLATMGATLLLKTLDGLERETIAPRAQDHSRATYAPKIAKEDGRIDWNMPARELFNRLRAFDPWPGAFTRWGGRNLKLFRPCPVAEEETKEKPGTVAQVSEKNLTIATAHGCLRVREVQLENRPRMGVAEFLRGYPLKVGELLGG